MKWNNAEKKPRPGEKVLVYPSKPMPLAYWDGQKESGLVVYIHYLLFLMKYTMLKNGHI